MANELLKIKKFTGTKEAFEAKKGNVGAGDIIFLTQTGEIYAQGTYFGSYSDAVNACLTTAKGYTDTEIGKLNADVSGGDKVKVTINEIKGILTSVSVDDSGMLNHINGVKEDLVALISGAFHFKGTKDSVASLPTTGNQSGDVWQVGTSEYAWNGTEWVELGSIVDLSAYKVKDVDTTVSNGVQLKLTGDKVGVDASGIKLETGNTNGSVKFMGTDVPVKGLGSAAYTDSANYATSAQGGKADTAIQTAEGDAYVNASASGTKISVSAKVQAVSTASASAKGLAEASDVKTYVDSQVQNKNVSASGDDYVSATASGNKVTVSATQATKDSLALANTALQQANITTGSTNGTISVKGTEVAVQGLGSAAYQESTTFASAENTYTKEQVFTKEEVNSLLTWAEFE